MKIYIYSIMFMLTILALQSTCVARESWLNSCKGYRSRVESILSEYNLSGKYYYLMVAESRCNDHAVSKAGAIGFWQLMPRTSKKFGCNTPSELTCATHAAAKYIKHLESDFHTFKDVISAYSMGGHNYLRAGRPTKEAVGLYIRIMGFVEMEKKHEKH